VTVLQFRVTVLWFHVTVPWFGVTVLQFIVFIWKSSNNSGERNKFSKYNLCATFSVLAVSPHIVAQVAVMKESHTSCHYQNTVIFYIYPLES